MKLLALVVSLFVVQLSTVISLETTSLPSNCVGLEDGKYAMLLINSPEYPILTDVRCSNEYMIIDYSTENKWTSYFSSWLKYHYAVAGPSGNDHSNWKGWFLPSELSKTSNFLLSPKCNKCDANDDINKQHFAEYSAYYLSSLAFGCFNPTRGWPACDMDFDTYDCKICEWNADESQIFSYLRHSETLEEIQMKSQSAGVCDFEIRSSMQSIATDYKDCQTKSSNTYKPSLGLDGKYCVCTKLKEQKYFEVSTVDLEKAKKMKLITMKVQTMEEKTSSNNNVNIYQENLKFGTYRITESGTYKIMEDIVFDFNAGSVDDVLAEGAWWPTSKQRGKYDGADGVRGAYFLGFFAGITIETDDVILDLNGYTLEMAKPFFYTQPFFSIIELASQAFLPQQGPGFFGSDPKFATNVVIENGVLGLSSHHSIHGNYNKHITIRNIVCKYFQTHGIQLNGFTDITLENVEIGPTTDKAILNGNFGQLREILPTLRKIAQKSDKTITFANRDEAVTMQDILDELEPLMVQAFNYAAYDLEVSNKEMKVMNNYFINDGGLPYGAVTYGLFFNYPSAGIFGWHVNDANSDGVTLKNVKIHGLKHAGNEILGLANNGRVFCNAFNGPLPLKSLLGRMQAATWTDALLSPRSATKYGVYVGDIITDTWLAMYYFGKSDFDVFPGIPFVGDSEELLEWAMDASSTYVSSNTNMNFDAYCNEDAMFHPSKGLLALKISGSMNVVLDNVEIYDIKDTTPLGLTQCGAKDLYHFSQQRPYQIGFSMNMVHGITIDYSAVTMSNINIHDLYSDTGLVYGIAAWFDTTIKVGAGISLSELHAGITGVADHFSFYSRPNKLPEVCAIRFEGNDIFQVSIEFEDTNDDLSANSISQTCMSGAIGCLGIDGRYTTLGKLTSSMSCSDDMTDVDVDIDRNSGLREQPRPEPRPEGVEEDHKIYDDEEKREDDGGIYSEYDAQAMISGGWVLKTLVLVSESPIAYVVVIVLAMLLLFCVKKVYYIPPHVKHGRIMGKMGYYGSQFGTEDDYGTF